LCAPLKFCGPMLRLALEKLICFPNRVFLLGNKIFLVEEKRTCFQLEVGLSTEAASFSWCLASFVSSFTPNDMLRHVENETTLQKPLNRWGDAFGNVFQSAHGCFGRPKVWYGCLPKLNLLAKWEYEIVSKRVSELPFFSTYAFVRTFENEQISSNVHFFWLSFTD